MTQWTWDNGSREWQPGNVRGDMWLESLQHPEEIGSLLELAKIANVNTVLEIGAGPCGTGIYLQEKLDAFVVAVDLPIDIGGTPQAYEDMARAKTDQWTMVRGDSGEESTKEAVLKALDGRQVGLLFIDGEHTRKAAEADYNLYRPLLEKEGVIAFHDITLPELWSMWCALRGKRHPIRSFEFIEDKQRIGFGIGALLGRDEGF